MQNYVFLLSKNFQEYYSSADILTLLAIVKNIKPPANRIDFRTELQFCDNNNTIFLSTLIDSVVIDTEPQTYESRYG